MLWEGFIGRFTEHHAFLLTKMHARIGQLGADIADVEERTNAQIARSPQRSPASMRCPGWGRPVQLLELHRPPRPDQGRIGVTLMSTALAVPPTA